MECPEGSWLSGFVTKELDLFARTCRRNLQLHIPKLASLFSPPLIPTSPLLLLR